MKYKVTDFPSKSLECFKRSRPKALCALHTYKKIVGRIYGLKPYILHYDYETPAYLRRSYITKGSGLKNPHQQNTELGLSPNIWSYDINFRSQLLSYVRYYSC